MKRKITNFVNYKYFPYLIILIVSSLLIITFKDNYIKGDDTFFHVSNIEVIRLNLFNLSKIRPIIGNNFGYGIGIFYPQLPHIFSGVIAFITSDTILSMKITKYIVTLLSGIVMYIYASKVFKDKHLSLVASISYITSSYFIVDMFYRDAFNESFVFVFMPIVFLGFYYLFDEDDHKKFILFFTLGYIGLLYSHLVLSVWFTIYVLIYLLFNIKEVFKNLKYFIIASLFILLITSPYTVLLSEHMINKSYYITSFIYEADRIWRISPFDYILRINWTTTKAYLFVSLSYISTIGVIIGIIRLFKEKNKSLKKLLIIFLILSGLAITFTSSYYSLAILPNFLLNIQFAWRNATFVVFFLILFSVEGFSFFYKGLKTNQKILPSAVIILFLLVHMFDSLNLVKTYDNIDSCISSCGMGWETEYLPNKTIDNEYIDSRSEGIIILNGKANINIILNETPDLVFDVNDLNDEAIIELPRIYYLGYELVDSNDNIIDYDMDDNGFISAKITNNGTYKLSYEGTKLYKVFRIISFVTIIVFIIYVFKRKITSLTIK